MEFNSLADLLKQIRYWENQVARLEAAAGLKPARSVLLPVSADLQAA